MGLQSRQWKQAAACVACVTVILLLLLALFVWNHSPMRPWNPANDSVTLSTATSEDVRPRNGTRGEAYVALFYGGFFPAMRVLGQSLRASRTTRDYVALCMNTPAWAKRILKSDGWIIKSVNPLPKTCGGDRIYSRHFAKIQAWLLTEYSRVISIDSDAIVLHNIDHLFKCGEFCAAYRHSDLFNTGVVVLKPSLETFQDICKNIQRIGSYTSGDQGFLNYYYEDLKNAPMFSKDVNTTSEEKFLRLPAEYNGDVSVFYVVNKWMYIDVEEPYILHYTLGPVKPWKWWTYPLFSLNWRWKKLRDQLPTTNLVEPSLWHVSSWLPIPLLAGLYLMSRMCSGLYIRLLYRPLILKGAKYIGVVGGKVDKIFPPLSLAVALYLAYPCVPLDMSPLEAWTRFGIWVLLFFVIPFSAYCHLAYYLGRQEVTDDGKVVSTPHRIVAESLFWLILATLVYYLEFLIPSVLLSMKHRAVTFISLGVLNFILCYFFGLRLISLSYYYS